MSELGIGTPFEGVTIEVSGSGIDDRRPFTGEELTAIRQHIHSHGGPVLFDIWTLLEFTGCRLSEIRGLAKAQVHLGDEPCPHIQALDGRAPR